MADPTSNAFAIEAIQTELAATKKLSALSGSERKQIENAIYPVIGGYRVMKGSGTDYAAYESGDILMTIDSAGKKQIVGQVIGVPFDPATDLENRSKFDLYKNDSPAL